MIPGSANPLLLTSAAAAGGYEIERSLRFNSADSARLTKSFSSTNRRTWTYSCWAKRTKLDGSNPNLVFLSRVNGSAFANIGFFSDKIRFQDSDGSDFVVSRVTEATYRDTSAWYHVVIVLDTTNATQDDRARIYVNGSRITAFATSNNIASSAQGQINLSGTHEIGRDTNDNVYTNGYLADVFFVDGQALDPTSFGEFDDNGIWQPIEYTGTYGTNGFHLPFSDNSTAASLGDDTSGNNNDWTVNNISVASGAGNDSLIDSPTNGTQTDTGVGGEVIGNYATLNPLNSPWTLSNGNLRGQAPGSPNRSYAPTTIYVDSGKWYAEFSLDDVATYRPQIGVVKLGDIQEYIGISGSQGLAWEPDTDRKYQAGTDTSSFYGQTFTGNIIVGLALDMDAGTLDVSVDGVSLGELGSGLSGFYSFAMGDIIGTPAPRGDANFGQRPFAYTAPSGFKALCTANLPAPTIEKGSDYFETKLYTGNGSTQTISGLDFSPDLVWIKNRAQADNHKLLDTVRGATNELESNTTDAEVANADGLTAFNSDGFALGADVEYNTSSEAYVAWTWDAGSSTVTNTDGSISSQVRANASAGFSVVTYTGTGSAATVGHGLGVAPSLILVKSRSLSTDWLVYHSALGGTQYIWLNLTNAAVTDGAAWNNTNPTSSVFSLSTGSGVNASAATYVAYCFAPVEGYSAFGSYVGDNAATSDSNFVYLGFRPRFLMIKCSSSSSYGYWHMFDSARDTYNVAYNRLAANSSSAENSYGWGPNTANSVVDFLSNGFKIRTSGTDGINRAQTYIYAAFAENPFALNARAR